MLDGIQKLNMFTQFLLRKLLRIWKHFVMYKRVDELKGAALARPSLMYPGFYETHIDINELYVDTDDRVSE